MKLRYIQINGELIPADEATQEREYGPYVQGALKPFISMVDGKEVTSRAKYRADLRAHGYEEVGNEIEHLMKPREIPDVAPGQRKELIAAQIRELGHEGFRKALQRDVEFVKWNSRGLPRN